MLKIFLIALTTVSVGMFLASTPGSAVSLTFKGKAVVLSGDSLSVGGTVLRLKGIDAPEKRQLCRVANGRAFDCGLVSKTALMDLTVASTVFCRLTGATLDDLPEVKCSAGGYDLSEGMVHTGWALAWPKSGTKYGKVQNKAQKAGNGMWRGEFIAPWDWRRGLRLANEGTAGAR
jgi:endonuclease YncB( thermonuclease family)